MEVSLHPIRIVASAAVIVSLSFAQGTAQDSAPPTFRSATNLVVVPFQVRRGQRSVSNLNPSEVMLLEDGVPRSFTIFEASPVHLTLDIVVMFDVTNRPAHKPDQKGTAGFWDA